MEDLRANADAVLQQVTTEDPDQGAIRRAVMMIKVASRTATVAARAAARAGAARKR